MPHSDTHLDKLGRHQIRLLGSTTNLLSPKKPRQPQKQHTYPGPHVTPSASVANLQELGVPGFGFAERVQARLSEVIDDIDREVFGSGDHVVDPDSQRAAPAAGPIAETRNLMSAASGSASCLTTSSISKVWLYSNSRLPPYLPPFKVYVGLSLVLA